jgi:excisionase family DNA binding protein
MWRDVLQYQGVKMEATKLYSVKEIAILLHVTKPTIHNWVRLGFLKALSFPNGRKKFTKEQIEKFIKEQSPDTTIQF